MYNASVLRFTTIGKPINQDLANRILNAGCDIIRKGHNGVKFLVEGVCKAKVERVSSGENTEPSDRFFLSAKLEHQDGSKSDVSFSLPAHAGECRVTTENFENCTGDPKLN